MRSNLRALEKNIELKLYGDYLSGPFRACIALLMRESTRVGKWEFKEMVLRGDGWDKRFEPDYLKINPFGKIPTLQVTEQGKPDLNIFESIAILKYICDLKKLPDHWYPTSAAADIELRAKMDMYLNWHHTGTRGNRYFFKK